MNTQFPSKGEIVRQWHVLDAEDLVLGRVASKAALLLMGKHKPTYTPFLDTGDHVIVINADKGPADRPERRAEALSSSYRISRRAGRNRRAQRCAPPAPPR